MTTRFCTQCGAKLLPDGRYCAACGQAVGGAPPVRRRFPIERWAPALVLAAVVAVGGSAVLSGARSAPPPNVPPPRAVSQSAPEVPDGHPPVEIPDDVRKVIAKLAAAAKDKPDDIDAWQQLAFVQYRAGQVDPAYLADASTTYAHILERQPENLDALRGLGNIAFDRNEPEHALEYYRRYLKVKPDDLGVQTDVGTMLLSSQQVEAALKIYRDVLTVDPKFFQAQFNLAIAYRAAGDNEQALAALQRARDIAGDDATRQRVDALLARLKGEPPPAGDAEAAAGGDLRSNVEAIFRSHPIVGPKLDRIDWPSDDRVRVVLRDFPMDGMPPMVRDKFTERIRGGLRDSAARHQATPPTVELVDSATGRVMETVTVTASAAAAPAAAAPVPAAPPPAGGDLHGEVEAIFRSHPIVGPKLDRIDWPSDDHARVLLREFPMEAMPPMVRDKFADRIHNGVRDSKARHQTTGSITVELVDAGSGRVMETITE